MINSLVVISAKGYELALGCSSLRKSTSEINKRFIVKVTDNENYVLVPEHSVVMLSMIFSYLYHHRDLRNCNRFSFEISAFEKYFRANFRGEYRNAFVFEITSLLNIKPLQGESFLEPIFDSITITDKHIEVSSKYFQELMNELAGLKQTYWYTNTLCSSIVRNRNKYAVVGIMRLAVLLAQGGNYVKGKVLHISIKELIGGMPDLRKFLSDNKHSTGECNRKLKQLFTQMQKMLDADTLFYSRYSELKIEFPKPDIRQLQNPGYKIKITHAGVIKNEENTEQ